MEEVLKYLKNVIDNRQEKKVRHKMSDIIGLVFFALLSNANEWTTIEIFGKEHEVFLRRYLEFPNGIPSHDTIERVFAMVSAEFLQKFHMRWNEALNSDEGEKVKKILAIDGKTQCGNRKRNQKANHIVSAVDENGFCLGEKLVDEKTNEIVAIPELIDDLNVTGHIITTDAMGCQIEIVKKIRKKHADYVLALKGNQGNLQENVQMYFDDQKLLSKCAYMKTVEKAHGGIEKREYWQTDDISWLPQKKEWVGLKSLAMTKNTITKNGLSTTETRYYICSLALDIKGIARAIRRHWMVESYHWHLDVTFGEDTNRTLEKQAAFNLNVIRKLAINTLKIFDIAKKTISLKMKRFMIGTNPERHLETILKL